jgi:hypothetical protein
MVGITGRFNAAAITQQKMVNDSGAHLSLFIIPWHSAPRSPRSSTNCMFDLQTPGLLSKESIAKPAAESGVGLGPPLVPLCCPYLPLKPGG